MNSLIVFLLKSSAVFTLFYLVFQLLLRKHTFHQLNRIILLCFIPFSIYVASTSFMIPIATNSFEIPVFIELSSLNDDNSIIENTSTSITDKSVSPLSIISTIYSIGVLISLFIFLKSLIRLYNLKHVSKVQKTQKYQLVHANVTEVFSCFNWIFIPKNSIDTVDAIILEHEKKHIDHKHTIDLFLTELYIAFFWFNPFVYFYRKSIKSIHEYQADSEVLNHQQIDIISYLKLLKIEIENTSSSNLYSHFRQPLIKKRIEMIMKTKSNILLKLKYLILLPIAFLCMVSFTKQHTIIPASIISEIINENTTKPSISPIKNISKVDITAKYGPAKHPILKTMRHHNGIDFRASNGTPIVSTADGVISNASYEKNWGNLIIIKHDNGYETLYAHLSKFNCKKNQTVKRGEVIGYSGSTGLVTGPHLHYSIKHNNEYVNPIDFIN